MIDDSNICCRKKPHNILLDEDGNVKISDMGLARRLDPQNHSFSTLSSGTVGYQAPEVS